jgi:hypothetical protein
MSTVSAAATTSYATMTSATTGAMTMMGTAASALIAAATTMTSGAGSNMVAQLLGVAGGGISPRTFVNDAGGVEIAGSLGFANGGIMTSMGPASLKKYAAGGIATSPQLALFGEGSMNEAYVPLPDGRSIPVTLSGAANTTNMGGVQINIVVNKDGSTEQQSAGDDATQWQRVAQRVRSVVMEELVTQQRPGGVLYK